MARILLIHGAWGNATSWTAITPMLTRAGHQVEALNLPGHGKDAQPSGEIGQADYVNYVEERLMDGPPAMLVGHSMGGIVIAQVAARQPAQTKAAIFVTALLPRDGESLLDLVKRQDAPGVQPYVTHGPVPGTTLLTEGAAEALFPEASPAMAAKALAAMSPQSNKAQKEKALVGPGLSRVPKAYVHCAQDRVVTPDLQNAMVAATPCDASFLIDGGHVPMLTHPHELAEILLGLAAQV